MSAGRWHLCLVSDDGDVDVFHPHECPWSITHRPDIRNTRGELMERGRFEQDYICDVAAEIDEIGTDALPSEPGAYWVRAWKDPPDGRRMGRDHWRHASRPRW